MENKNVEKQATEYRKLTDYDFENLRGFISILVEMDNEIREKEGYPNDNYEVLKKNIE